MSPMPDPDLANLQAQLTLLREQVEAQLTALHREIAAMLESGAQPDALRAKVAEWERRETELGEKLAARNVEYQSLRARAEIDAYRQQLRIEDLEKQLALRDSEVAKLKAILNALAAEHAGCADRPSAAPQDSEQIAELQGQLQFSREECRLLRASIDDSVALKLARSLPWLLGPVRRIFAKGAQR
jgi:hypothetical protein